MKQVIIKSHLGNRSDFEAKLFDIGLKFGPVFWQHDRVFLPRSFKPKSNFPRLILRTEIKATDQPATYYLILRRHIEDSGIDIINQSEVKDYLEATALIHQLGFTIGAEVSRQRQTLVMENDLAIHLDQVEGLSGFYAKFETNLREGDKVSEVRSDLEKTLEVLGEKDLTLSTYARLLMK